MRLALVEGWRMWPLIAAATVALMVALAAQHPSVWLMLGLANPTLIFAKIERFRRHGLDVVVACELAAEQLGEDAEDVAAEHFAWKLEDTGLQQRRETVE